MQRTKRYRSPIAKHLIFKTMSSITTGESNEALAVAIVRAINENQITVEFDIHGRIIAYNKKFIILMDCSREELADKCNSDFLDPKSKSTSDYNKFWDALRSGQSFTGEFELIAKNGRRIWLFANYTPVLGLDGKVQRVIMIASDITSSKETSIANSGIRDAIERSMAVIEFTPDGTIKRANDLFCTIMGYSEDKIRGSHHKMFLNAE